MALFCGKTDNQTVFSKVLFCINEYGERIQPAKLSSGPVLRWIEIPTANPLGLKDLSLLTLHIWRRSRVTMAEIRTLVYFDLEATGLKSSGTPRVCEISLLAVNTNDVLDLHVTLMDHLKNRKTEETLFQVESLFPRVMNKLTLCVYPMATIIPFVSSLTGLDNYNLTGQSNFDKDIGHLLNMFLARLPFPVCLVAHNGNLYDFPLLKAEMEKAGTKLGSQILCADSYIGMKEIFKKRKEINEAEVAKKKEIERADKRKYIKSELEAVTELLKGRCQKHP